MKRRILVGNDCSCMGKFLSERLMSFGYTSDLTDNTFSDIFIKLSEKKYSCIIMFIPFDNSMIYDFLDKLRSDFENIIVMAVVSDFSTRLFNRLSDKKIDKIITLPASVDDICRTVMKAINKYDYECFRPEISDLLVSLKFPEYLSGFNYLCTAIEICVERNQYDKFSTMALYEEIGRRMKLKPSCIERSLRNFLNASLCRSSVMNFLGADNNRKLNNSKLISKTAKQFAKTYNLLDEDYKKSNKAV